MLNRRHLRIKALQILYAFYQTEDAEFHKSEKQLMGSLDKMYDLYLYFLLIFEELHDFAAYRIDERKEKTRATKEDLNPNTKFIDNRVIALLKSNEELRGRSETNRVDWRTAEKNNLMKKLFEIVVQSELYQDYMDAEEDSFDLDMAFILELFKSDIANFELLHDFFEDDNVYWVDDIDFVCSMVLKTFKTFTAESDQYSPILALFKDETDEKDFIKRLTRGVVTNDNSNNLIIDELTKNWDLERIAKMDVILLKMAITELTEFSSIPKKVTLNEYIEISKFYSTPQSKVFINGVLDKAIVKLEKEGKIKKAGRGLMN
jgi:N utilization substance protein B